MASTPDPTNPTAPTQPSGKRLLGRRSGAPASRPVGEPQAAGSQGAARPGFVSLSWTEEDIENRLGLFKGGRFTAANKTFTFILAALVSAVFLGLMFLMYKGDGTVHRIGQVFVRPNNLPATIPATLFFFWGAIISLIKLPKLRLQRRALELAAVPQHQEFILNEATARTVLERMRGLVDDTRHFVLLNRIDRALSSLHNIGGVSDVSVILNNQAENDENQIASSYALIHAMIWAIPVLGFVGTVLGLSVAMAKFNVNASDAAQLRESLGDVVGGLSTAFETTLVGLVFALLLHLLSDLTHQKEMDFLDECNDYTNAHVISKLRVREIVSESK